MAKQPLCVRLWHIFACSSSNPFTGKLCGHAPQQLAASDASALLPAPDPTASPDDPTASAAAAEPHHTDARDRPLVDAPEFHEQVRDTDREAFWIPGAFPTIFQNETGDPYYYENREVDLASWGPHVLRSKGWHAQSHMTFMCWRINMLQRINVLSEKKWYVRDNPQAQGYNIND